MDAPISHVTLNGPHNNWYIYWSVWLGCAVLQPDKIMWLLSQVMRRNMRGLRGDMYCNPESENVSLGNNSKPKKSGWMIAVGDELIQKDIPEPLSITSQYGVDRFGKHIVDRSIVEPGHQHVIGLLYVISLFGLWSLITSAFNIRSSFYEEKTNQELNTLCYSEDYKLWDSNKQSFDRHLNGQWHFSGITPRDSGFLDGTAMLGGGTKLVDLRA